MGIIFDLDGTLLNSLEDLKNSLNIVLDKYDLPQHSSEKYQEFVGNGMKMLVKRAIPKDHSQETDIIQEFLDEYSQRYYEKSRPYHGIKELLKELNNRNIPISVCTNKKQEYTDEIIKRFFADIKFEEVIGDRFDGKHKPNPHYPLKIAKAMELEPNDIFFIGDSDVDMQTAKNANMKPIGVSWGFRSVKELKENGALAILETPNSLFKLL